MFCLTIKQYDVNKCFYIKNIPDSTDMDDLRLNPKTKTFQNFSSGNTIILKSLFLDTKKLNFTRNNHFYMRVSFNNNDDDDKSYKSKYTACLIHAQQFEKEAFKYQNT